jgi:hypothetical protein
MGSANTSEYKIGPFEYGEAVSLIKKYALALTNLGLSHRFSVLPSPQPVMEYEKRRDGRRGRFFVHHQVVIVDRFPDEPKPEGLTTLDIRAAEAEGYRQKKPRTTYYEALGQSMTIGKWAEAVGVSRATLKARIDAGMTMEEAITQIALKKAG